MNGGVEILPGNRIGLLLIWVGAFVGWVFVSPFVHELCHFAAAALAGFKVRGCRFISVPGGAKGYVEVAVVKGTKRYYLKRGIMHLAGVMAHLVLAGAAFFLFVLARETAFKGVWLAGFVVNLYLLVMNSLPADSDGRQFWEMIGKKKANQESLGSTGNG